MASHCILVRGSYVPLLHRLWVCDACLAALDGMREDMGRRSHAQDRFDREGALDITSDDPPQGLHAQVSVANSNGATGEWPLED